MHTSTPKAKTEQIGGLMTRRPDRCKADGGTDHAEQIALEYSHGVVSSLADHLHHAGLLCRVILHHDPWQQRILCAEYDLFQVAELDIARAARSFATANEALNHLMTEDRLRVCRIGLIKEQRVACILDQNPAFVSGAELAGSLLEQAGFRLLATSALTRQAEERLRPFIALER